MSTSSDVSLGSLRIQAKERSDLENNPSVSDAEWNSYLSNSYKRLYNMLIAAYGNDYYVANTYVFNLTNSQNYPLPDGTPNFIDSTGATAQKFYKLLGVDLQYSASPSGWVTMKRFEMISRNRYAYPNTAINFNGYTNLRYRVSGNTLMFMPVPMAGQVIRIFYAPAPTSIQFMLPGYTTASSNVIGSMSDTTGLSIGMNVYSSLQGVVNQSTISQTSTTTVTLSNTALSSQNANIFSFWNDATTFDGISGWEEFVIIDSAIKAQIKQEGDISGLVAERQDMVDEIQSMAEGRDIGQAMHVSDVLGASSYSDGYGGYGDGGGGWGDF